jgi:hypothetical protein
MLPCTDESTGPAMCQPAMPKLVISPSYTGVTRNVPTIQHVQAAPDITVLAGQLEVAGTQGM